MLLQQLKLENIRSYINQTINFSVGSTLLSGDIGSGKSTILLAIEFALFGTSRPDLPAELLLRKGTTTGFVELTLTINDQQITIKRNLKKEKNSIKQTAGHIIKKRNNQDNSIKKELMPGELKAEMISLLGYPEEFINKNKNHIYRYTVYTPQEEMKYILWENNEDRLDVLRKIFNIDKYKTIRENLQVFLKKTRTNIAILKTKTEPLPEQQELLKILMKEKVVLNETIAKLNPQLITFQKTIEQKKKELDRSEQQQKDFLELKHHLKTNQILLNEKEERNSEFKNKEKKLKQEIAELLIPENKTLTKLQLELKQIEEQKHLILTKKTSLQEKINFIQAQIENLPEEIKQITAETLKIKEKEELQQQLIEAISGKEELQQQKIKIEENLQTISGMIVKNQTFFSQSQELQQKIINLENCPTCLQTVSEEHKQKITKKEQQKIKGIEQQLQELTLKKEELSIQKETIDRNREQIVVKENLLTKINFEIIQIQEKKEQLNQKQEQFKSLIIENNVLMQKLEVIEKENNFKELDEKIDNFKNLIQTFTKKEILEKNVLELIQQIEENNQQKSSLNIKITEITKKITDKSTSQEDLTLNIEIGKKEYLEITQQEKELAIKIATINTQIENIKIQEERLNDVVNKLNEEKNKLIRLKEIYHWLDAYFLKLTYTIEKQVMVNIHNHFNLMFQEWFSILIDDENIYAKIDDSFTPIVEQNGYEISFNHLSGGEKTSAALAYRLALNRVVNDVINEINTKDLLILDEPTDGFSTEQLDKVRDVLEKLNLRQTIIVSHESKIESFVENVIQINKEGHVSQVI